MIIDLTKDSAAKSRANTLIYPSPAVTGIKQLRSATGIVADRKAAKHIKAHPDIKGALL